MTRRTLASMLALAVFACGSPTANTPTTDGAGKRCMPAPSSNESGSARMAAAPFDNCSDLLDMHCGGEDRYALCSYPLNVERTTAARAKQADMCCYGGAE